MTTTFLNRHLEALYATGTSRKYRLPARVVRDFVEAVNALREADSTNALRLRPGLNFEALRGTRRYSIRANRKYRVEFEMEWTNEEMTVGIVGIAELSNHYGD